MTLQGWAGVGEAEFPAGRWPVPRPPSAHSPRHHRPDRGPGQAASVDGRAAGPSRAPSVDSSLGLKLLPALLSVIAGSADVISFLGLGGLFVAHITGNLVILAAHLVSGTPGRVALLLSVPVFVLVLGLAKLLAVGLEAIGLASLGPLLLLQFVLLAGFLALGVTAGPHVDPNAATAILAGMLGVAAMAVQNALVQLSLRGRRRRR